MKKRYVSPVDAERGLSQGNTAPFYERYWGESGNSPAERGFESEKRKTLLKNSLRYLPATSPVLDAGCGSGEFLRFLSDLGFTVTGIDVSSRAISRARDAAPFARLAVASLEHGIPFADGSFTAIWCTEVLEHLFNVHAALAELNRVLGPDGLLVLAVPYHGLIKNLLIALGGFERHYNPYVSHIRFFTRRSLDRCLSNAGFTAVRWSGVGRRWPLWKSQFVLARKNAPAGPHPAIVG